MPTISLGVLPKNKTSSYKLGPQPKLKTFFPLISLRKDKNHLDSDEFLSNKSSR